MAIVDVSLPTGFEADLESVNLLLSDQVIKRFEDSAHGVIFYFDEVKMNFLTAWRRPL